MKTLFKKLKDWLFAEDKEAEDFRQRVRVADNSVWKSKQSKLLVNKISFPTEMKEYTPQAATSGSAGVDLLTTINFCLAPNERKLIPTGIGVAVPVGFEAQVRSRSGLALNHGITVLNGVGTIDSDYRGEIRVVLINLGDAMVSFQVGDRIAQLVFSEYCTPKFVVDCEQLGATERNAGGFGSTGMRQL